MAGGQPTLRYGRTVGGLPCWQPGPTALLMVMYFLNFGAGQTLIRKDVQIYFSKDFDARKYFWIFVKNRKSARKVSSMYECFENSNMQWEKLKKSREVKWWKSKYEIHTDLPSARARRFESDERDISPVVITTAWLDLENWMRTSWRPYTTPSLHVFSLILWS